MTLLRQYIQNPRSQYCQSGENNLTSKTFSNILNENKAILSKCLSKISRFIKTSFRAIDVHILFVFKNRHTL